MHDKFLNNHEKQKVKSILGNRCSATQYNIIYLGI
jgi:hypothetical protein